jgi:hypothetical protein
MGIIRKSKKRLSQSIIIGSGAIKMNTDDDKKEDLNSTNVEQLKNELKKLDIKGVRVKKPKKYVVF